MLFVNVAEKEKTTFYIYFRLVCETYYKTSDTLSKCCECYSVFQVTYRDTKGSFQEHPAP